MTTIQKAGFTISIALLCITQAFGQAKPTSQKPAAFIPEPVKKLDQLIGSWSGNIHSEIGPVIVTRKAHLSVDFAKGYKNLVYTVKSTYTVEGENKPNHSYGMIAYDTTDKEFHMMLMTDTAIYNLSGNWMNDYNLNFNGATVKGGKKLKITIWFGLKVKGEIGYKMYTTIDNSLISDDGKLKKVVAAPKK